MAMQALIKLLMLSMLALVARAMVAPEWQSPPPPPPSPPPSPPSPPSPPPMPTNAPMAFRIAASFVSIQGGACHYRKDIVERMGVPAPLVDVAWRDYLLPPSPPPLPPSWLPNASVARCFRGASYLQPVIDSPPPPPPPPPPDAAQAMSWEMNAILWVIRRGHANRLSTRLSSYLGRNGDLLQCPPSVTAVPVSATVRDWLALALNGTTEEPMMWTSSHWCDDCGRLRSDGWTREKHRQAEEECLRES